MNYEFNLKEWLPLFPLEMKYGHYSGDAITSPCDICNIEWLRREMSDQYQWGPPVPVDIFVMSLGEPENRFATKIGGLPYRDRSSPWPRTEWGQPMSLLAQFNFMNSLDIVGDLPGDLLLVFGDDSFGTNEPFHLEWQPLGIQDLVRPEDVPRGVMATTPCFGNRCRMASFPKAKKVSKDRYPQCRGLDVWSPYQIPQLQATQIGRAPYFIQRDDCDLPGRLLCTISSVQPDQHARFPWVNVADPICAEGDWDFDRTELMIFDMGCIYISIQNDGTLHAATSSY